MRVGIIFLTLLSCSQQERIDFARSPAVVSSQTAENVQASVGENLNKKKDNESPGTDNPSTQRVENLTETVSSQPDIRPTSTDVSSQPDIRPTSTDVSSQPDTRPTSTDATALEPTKAPDIGKPPQTKSLQIKKQVSVSAPGHEKAFTPDYSIPLGWGYMDPVVVLDGGEAIAPIFFPCSLVDKKTYCIRLFRESSGGLYGPVLDFKKAFAEFGKSVDVAYQPPMLFIEGTEVYAAFWGHSSSESKAHVALFSIDLRSTSPVWKARSILTNDTNGTYNYFGGGFNHTLRQFVVAGWAQDMDEASLKIYRIGYPFSNWEKGGKVVSYSSPYFKPIYPHVFLGDTGELSVLTTVGNMEPCSATGKAYTNYKNVALFRGKFGGSFTAVFSNASRDLVKDQTGKNTTCLFNNMRFARDLFVDSNNHAFSVIHATDADDSNRITDGHFFLYKDAVIIDSALESRFSAVVKSSEILSINVTQANTKYFLIANTNSKLAIVSTTDFKSYSEAFSISVEQDGIANAAKIFQPSKAGPGNSEDVLIWHGGWDVANVSNKFLKFMFHRVGF